MLKSNLALLSVLYFVINYTSYAQQLHPSQHLDTSHGLTHSETTAVIEDSKGYIWVGTFDGLNRYDGYECKQFKNTIEKNIILNNRVRSLQEDSKGNIWIGTHIGVSLYNYEQQQFTDLYSSRLGNMSHTEFIVRKIYENKANKQTVCLTENKGFLLFNADYTLLKHILPPKTLNPNSPIKFFDALAIDAQHYLFATSIGLVLYEQSTDAFELITQRNGYFESSFVKRIDDNTYITPLTKGLGIFKLTPTSSTNSIGYTSVIVSKHLKEYRFNIASIDERRNLWLSTPNDGIVRVNNLDQLIHHQKVQLAWFTVNRGDISVSDMVTSNKTGCWVATYTQGLYRFENKVSPFTDHFKGKNAPLGFQSDNILSACAIDSNRVYICSLGDGLTLLNTKSNQFEPLPFSFTPKQAKLVRSVFFDQQENLWLQVGNDGLYRLKKGEHIPERLLFSYENDFLFDMIRCYSQDQQNNIWLGCSEGVYKLILDSTLQIERVEELNTHTNFAEQPLTKIRCIYSDTLKNAIWIGSEINGLTRLSNIIDTPIKKHDVQQYTKNKRGPYAISNNSVSSVCRLPNKELWIGTEYGGMCKITEDDNKVKFHTIAEKYGLSNHTVKGFLCDDSCNLWIATNTGLNKFDNKQQRFRSFGKNDGLPFELFRYASTRLKNGYLLFGGYEGLCFFNPNDVYNKEPIPQLEFGDLYITNQLIQPNDTINDRVVIKKRITDGDNIVLKHYENEFSISLKSLHFSTHNNRFLRYRLYPLNETWIEVTSDQQHIRYNELPLGEYELQVSASNSLSKWSPIQKIGIVVTPPFWKTTVAYVCYIILVGLIIYAIIFVILRIQSLKHNLQIEQLELDKVQEVNAEKLRYFSNISHEIKTPLSLISEPIELLTKRFSEQSDIHDKLIMVQRQSHKMKQLINQVHDFQRSDANLLERNFTHFCFDSLLDELITDFSFLANRQQKTIQAEGQSEKIYVHADEDKLGKIFNNLLSNAFKYTAKNDVIKVSYYRTGNELIVKVTDSGRGIDPDDLPHIFERFYQSQKKHSAYIGGAGIGLAFSKRLVEMHYGYISAQSVLHERTTIEVKLPIVVELSEINFHQSQPQLLQEEKQYINLETVEVSMLTSDITTSGEHNNALIYLAEDNPDMNEFVGNLLSNFFQVKTFQDGKECIQALDEEWPDLIISDVLMPQLNGFDLCNQVKGDIKTNHIPIILLTACSSIADQIQGLASGADAYLKKPFHTQQLISQVESLLRSRKLLHERFKNKLPLKLEKNQDDKNTQIFLEKLYDLMDENLDNQELEMDDLAKALFLNRTHFYKKIKTITNKTPFELLKTYRISRAAELLSKKGMSVNDAFSMTGFKSRSHFSRFFKETYQLSPSKYAAQTTKSETIVE